MQILLAECLCDEIDVADQPCLTCQAQALQIEQIREQIASGQVVSLNDSAFMLAMIDKLALRIAQIAEANISDYIEPDWLND